MKVPFSGNANGTVYEIGAASLGKKLSIRAMREEQILPFPT